MTRVRLKLKAKRRRSQRGPKYQMDLELLGKRKWRNSGRCLKKNLVLHGPTGSVEEVWSTFKGALIVAQECSSLVPRKEEMD